MVNYHIKYHTLNEYEEEVTEGIFDLLIMPQQNGQQELLDYKLSHSLPGDPFVFKNKFGYDVIRVRSMRPFHSFEFEGEFQVRSSAHIDDAIFNIEEKVVDWFTHDFHIQHHLYLYQTDFTQLSRGNQQIILRYKTAQSPFEYMQALNEYIHKLLKYEPKITTVHTSANDVILLKKGVCQDYVHLFIGMARANRIPCRYVSGYLNQGKNFVGAARMHAWAEAYVPDKGWIGFDPTNALLVDANYVKVALGVDYSDCSPIKGVLKTTGANTTNYSVKMSEQ